MGENLLARLRDGQLVLNPEITSALLAMVDAVREMLRSIEKAGNEGERNDDELIVRVTGLLGVKPTTPTQAVPSGAISPKPEPAVVPILGEILIQNGTAKAADVEAALQQQQSGDPRHIGEILVEKGTVRGHHIVEALSAQQQVRGQSASDSTIRVDVGQLDRLMNRVGELVLLRNQIVQYTNSMEDSELLGASQRLNLLTTELQESVMKTRMQPIGNIWNKFPRTVRDMALGCGNQVRIETEGKETELDKTIIEAIKDPLTHLARNAVDHGIELPEARRAAGKNPEGMVFLRAFHEGGQVNIEVTDDGAGLDYDKLRNKAMQKGLVSADPAARMTEREIANLIFLPGFSTAEQVSNVSGRGVGMDVVKTNIEKIGGMVDVQSKPGQGSTVLHENSFDTGDHSGADRDQCRGTLRHPAGQPFGVGATRGRPDAQRCGNGEWRSGAGCSTGEEPYTLAMFLLEESASLLSGWTFDILATDLNDHSLTAAKSGIYGDYALRSTTEALRKKYFKPHDEKRLQASDQLNR